METTVTPYGAAGSARDSARLDYHHQPHAAAAITDTSQPVRDGYGAEAASLAHPYRYRVRSPQTQAANAMLTISTAGLAYCGGVVEITSARDSVCRTRQAGGGR
jgi:hypothetical protein